MQRWMDGEGLLTNNESNEIWTLRKKKKAASFFISQQWNILLSVREVKAPVGWSRLSNLLKLCNTYRYCRFIGDDG